MKTNMSRLKLLVNFVNLAIVLVIISMAYFLAIGLPYVGKFSDMSARLPDTNQFDGIRRMMHFIVYIPLLIMLVVHACIGVFFLAVRRFLNSIISNGVFHVAHANTIRKVAIFFLCLAGVALFFNFIYMLAAFNKGNMVVFEKATLNFISIFENYALSALIAFCIAEVFIAGIKLKLENDLTV
jgi:hypothetical protein